MFYNWSYKAASMNIYGVTAANDHESSLGCYCDYEAHVGGIYLDTCLGDEFSCRWMENSDAVDFSTYTMGEQVEVVRLLTEGSHVSEYGDTSPRSQLLIEYQGDYDQFVAKLGKFLNSVNYKPREMKHKTNNKNYYLHYLKNKAMKTKKQSDLDKYKYELDMKMQRRKLFDNFKTTLNVENKGSTDMACYKKLIKFYSDVCGRNTERDLEFFPNFYNYCSMGLGLSPAYKFLGETCRGNQ